MAWGSRLGGLAVWGGLGAWGLWDGGWGFGSLRVWGFGGACGGGGGGGVFEYGPLCSAA